MRRTKALAIILLGGVLSLSSSATTRAERPTIGEEPVAHWDFDDTLKDRAGTAPDILVGRDDRGVAKGVQFTTAAELPGTFGSAVALGVRPGDAQYLTAEVSSDTRLGTSYTIEAWIYSTHVGGWNRLALRWGAAPRYAYHFAIHDGVASLYHGQSSGEYVYAEGGEVQPNRWHHVVAVAHRDQAQPAAKLLVYVDGRCSASATFDGTIGNSGDEKLGVGDAAGIPSRGSRFRGYLDELTLWNRSLSVGEIRAHYEERAGVLARLEKARWQREIARRAKVLARIKDVGVERVVFAERGPGRDPSNHYYANFGYSCIDPSRWIHSRDGGRLCVLDLRSGELSVVLDDPGGAMRDPQVHYDGEKILFSYRRGGTHHYNLYEIDVDGSDLRQITSGEWDDVEPTYLPGGDIIFCSTRCRRWIGCWLAESATLHRCSPSGENLRMLSSGSFTENTPAVLPDGRVLYTRWEYVNRDPVSFHHLWTINPDGSRQTVYYGNMRPGGVFIDAKPIPNADRVVFINSPGHGANEHAGYVAVVSDRSGPNAESSLQQISRVSGFRDPYPLSEDAFLVARGRELLLMDGKGETEILYRASGTEVHEPVPLIRRRRERTIPRQTDLASTTGTLVISDVHLGRNMGGLERGTIKELLVLEDLPKPVNFHGGGSQPIGHGVTSTLKRILGTVPVEPDGSAHFEVPAMRSLYFALLDENGLSVKQMRSFVTVQPGETTRCIGCHERREEAPPSSVSPRLLALARAPSRIRPIADVPAIVDYPRDVQPILDRHCVRCHGHDKRDGGVSLVGDAGPVFSLSYYELFLHWQVKDTGGDPAHGSGRQPGNDEPYTTYSSASPLMAKIDGSHYDVALPPKERKIVRLWIDAGAQFPGTYAAYGTGQVGGCWGNNKPVREMADGWPSTPPARDAIDRRCGTCHPQEQLPRHVTARIPLDSWGDMLSWTRPLSRYSRHRLYNLDQPQHSLVLRAALAEQAGGYASAEGAEPRVLPEDRSRPPRPIAHPVVFADRSDPDYRAILAHAEAARAKLEEIKRFDRPGFRPNEHYVREMKRYEVLPPSFDAASDPIDVYATDEAYWRSFWHRPVAVARDPVEPLHDAN